MRPGCHLIAAAAALALGCGGGSDAADAGGAADARVFADAGPTLDASIVFDESVIRTFDIVVDETDWTWLNDNATLEQYVPATVNYLGDSWPNAAIRYKGGYGSLFSCFDGAGNRTCDKLSIKLKFSEYDPEGRFYGLKRINLHSMESDDSKMHDAIGYKLFRDAGVAAPRTAYVRVVVNGELQGLFVAVEAIDGRFTRDRFADGGEGNLYKEVWPVHATEGPYIAALKTNEDEMPSADKMVRFNQALAAAGDAGFAATVASWTDLDQLISYMAVARLIDHWDGIVAWYCVGAGPCFNHNYYWYESTVEDKVWLIPWDLDHTFEEPSPIRNYYGMPDWDEVAAPCNPIDIFAGVQGLPPSCDDFIRRMATQLWDDYAGRSAELIAGDFAPAAMTARVDQLRALLEDAVAEDPALDALTWSNAVGNLRTAINNKRAYIAGKL